MQVFTGSNDLKGQSLHHFCVITKSYLQKTKSSASLETNTYTIASIYGGTLVFCICGVLGGFSSSQSSSYIARSLLWNQQHLFSPCPAQTLLWPDRPKHRTLTREPQVCSKALRKAVNQERHQLPSLWLPPRTALLGHSKSTSLLLI